MKSTRMFAVALGLLALMGLALPAHASSNGVVISQAYGGGGNSGATYTHDFVELFNGGSAAVDLTGWSVQYASAAGSSWSGQTNLPAVVLQPGQYLLIQEAAGSGGSTALPTPDVIGTIAMAGSGGKLALVSNTTALSGSCPSGAAIIDFVGFSASANCYEGSGPTPAPSNTNAVLRGDAGCTDSDDNASDFTAGAPTPRNSTAPIHACGGGGPTNPSASGSANPAFVVRGNSTQLTVLVTPGTLPDSLSYTVTADLSAIGDANPATFTDAGPDGNGHQVFTYGANVAMATTPGSKSLPVSVVDDQARTASTNIVLTVTLPPVTIMQIQGHGAASPLLGQTVTTLGNVVTALTTKGFFMQDPNGDGDPTTSDGLYVYTGTAPSVAVGNVVDVGGKVTEFGGTTELTTPSVTVTAATGATIAAHVLDSEPPTSDPTTGRCMGAGSTIVPASDGYQASNFACLDGMLVAMDEAVVTGATYSSGGADAVHSGTPSGFYAALASQPRPARGPGVQFPGVAGQPQIPVWNGAPQVLTVYYRGLGFPPGSDDPGSDDPDYDDPSDFVYHAGTTFAVTGVIQGYQPSGAATPSFELLPREMTTLVRRTAAASVRPVADPGPGLLSIGSQNFLHLFNAVADGSANHGAYNDTCAGTGANDTCPTPAQYQIRLTKWARQVCDVLRAPIVLAVQEIENRGVLADLATQVQGRCAVSYVPYLIQGNDPGGINLGILARDDVVVDSVTQLFLNTLTVNCSSGASCTLNDRPPLLMRASWNGYPFALLSIYNRSMSGLPNKPYVGPKRAEQAAQVAQLAQAWQSGATLVGAGSARQTADGTITQGPFDLVGDAGVPLIVAGDFNAYEFSDGYADVTGMILGTADAAANVYWFNGNAANTDTPAYVAPSPTLVDSGRSADPAQRYSFTFGGLTQEIDHILFSRRGWLDFHSVSNAHGNADVSEASGVILNDLTAARGGDHDGQVALIVIDRIFADAFEASP